MLVLINENVYENIYSWYLLFLLEFRNYYIKLCVSLPAGLSLYLLLCFVLYVLLLKVNKCDFRGKRVLLVTAHPDDECMFFGPTVLKLKEDGVDVHILCLSDGNHDGLGNKRQKELWDACSELSIPDANIVLVRDTRLTDDPKVRWPVQHVSQIILNRLVSQDCDTLITFDRGGVSGHANHSSLFFAVAYMFVESQLPESCEVYVLDSINLFRKYCSYLDLPISYVMSSHRYFLPWKRSYCIVNAMKRHKSQMVWFRYLYVTFSRYIVINTLRKLTKDDIELELTIDE